MTEPLYYEDSLRTDFTATVRHISEDRRRITLSHTLFYPEGGGQPADRGTLSGAPVADVQKEHDGTIVHHVSAPLDDSVAPGSTVAGAIDRSHRWEYMQQHTGQHVLSAALMHVADAATVGVHQGPEVTTIEVERAALSDGEIRAVEDRANGAIRDDLAVRAFWTTADELSAYNLRRPTTRAGKIRLVEIDGYDLVACGGVHLPRTGMLNLVHTAGVERIRGRLRLSFKIGERALADYRMKDRAIGEIARYFSAHTREASERVLQLGQEVQELHRTRRLQAERIATLMLSAESEGEGVRTLLLEDEDEEIFRALAEGATADAGRRMCILNVAPKGVYWAVVIGGDHPFPAEELRARLLGAHGAKGGGKPPLWRGLIPAGDRTVAEAFSRSFREILR